VGRHLTRWLIPLPAILFAVFPNQANAEPTPGLETTYYTIDVIPPVKSDTEYPVCGTETENNINRSYDGELFEDCTYDLFMVHMTGFIEIPEHDTIEFMLASDDGGTIKIGSDEWGNWYDQGCTWMMSGPLQLDAGSQPLDLWMYENGGAACLMLAWNIDNAGWFIVPDEAFTQQAVATTTTVSSTTTSTTTTEPSTTTTSSTTTLPISTTTTTEPVQTSTTTSTVDTTTTTTATTSTTVPPAPTTTEAPYTPPQTTTTTPTTEPQPVPTTTEPKTTVDEPETTEPETSTTVPDETLPEPVEPDETTIPETSVPETFDEIVLDELEQPKEQETPLEDTPDTTVIEEQISSSITIAESYTESKIEEILTQQITSEQAVELVTNPKVLATLNEEQAETIFEQLDVDELTGEQLELFIEAIQEAPVEVKKAFENIIDIFDPKFDEYVPTGSNVPVHTRRTLVVIGSLLTMLPSVHIKTGKL